MNPNHPQPTGVERRFNDDEIIVSKTDAKGHITYANDVFLRIAGYTEQEVLGEPHSIIRHPAMPKCVFKLLWETIEAGEELFAYVINMAKNGDHYWVFAHVTPTFRDDGQIVGYHSSRRVPNPTAVTTIQGLYAELLEVEQSADTAKEGMQQAFDALVGRLEGMELEYAEFAFALELPA